MSVGIRELRDSLSSHLQSVREGQTVVVTDHGKPIARIVPFEGQSPFERLVASGLLVLPAGGRSKPAPPVKIAGTASDLVAEQRA
jgi:prevent-host-death family protein